MERFGDLPQNSGELFLMDGGIETDLIFNRGVDLPDFASFVLVGDPDGERVLSDYYADSATIAREHGTGFVFEAPLWRASSEWGAKLGYDADRLRGVNSRAIELLRGFAAENDFETGRFVLSAPIGPRGDGYVADATMSADEAAEFHSPQVRAVAEAGADLVTATTMTHVGEAAGVALAAADAGISSVIGFTVEIDGTLPDGTALGTAIEAVDAASPGTVSYFMINCAHTEHFGPALLAGEAWTERVGSVRANASRLSHAELDEAEELDDGDPTEFGREYAALRESFPGINTLGGCCGTDHRHIAEVAKACS